jgi:hypothetical protein
MGKHALDIDKAAFLVHLQYVHQAEAARRAGILKQTASDLQKRAEALKADHEAKGLPPPTLEEQVARKEGSGAKPKITDAEVLELLEACTLNKKQRKKLWHIVAREEGFFDLHRSTIKKKLRARGLRRAKSTKKLGLTDIQKAQRYEIALSRKDWGLAEWRKVIFSDKAAIVVSAKRGQQNISRMAGQEERYHPDCIKRRYNNYSEAMFWACFTYDHKGPCHIYYPETAEQKAENEERIERLNEEEIIEECRAEFEAQEREKERRWVKKGQKWPKKRATWEVFWKRNQYKKTAKRGGVDNIRYTYEVIEPLLIPFYKEIKLQDHDPDTSECGRLPFVFQQDNAPSHASKWTIRALKKAGIPLLEHIGNSPDMNVIEGAWMPIRIAITQEWQAPHTLEWTDRAWRAEWERFPQDKIRALVARMAVINTLIIEREGGNEFHG